MKSLVILFIAIFIITSCNSKKIKTITISHYSVLENFGEPKKDSLEAKTIYKYDEKGNQIEYVSYNLAET